MTTTMTDKLIQEVRTAYIEALYFTDTGETEDGQPARDAALSVEANEKISADVGEFLLTVSEAGLLEQYLEQNTTEQLGHDFWLTRNRHGVGFWDRNLGALGDKLTTLAQNMGERFTYEGDDGLIYMV